MLGAIEGQRPKTKHVCKMDNETHWLREGEDAGRSALLSRGGTRGAEWHADQRKLEGDARRAFVAGFNEVLDNAQPQEEN